MWLRRQQKCAKINPFKHLTNVQHTNTLNSLILFVMSFRLATLSRIVYSARVIYFVRCARKPHLLRGEYRSTESSAVIGSQPHSIVAKCKRNAIYVQLQLRLGISKCVEYVNHHLDISYPFWLCCCIHSTANPLKCAELHIQEGV